MGAPFYCNPVNPRYPYTSPVNHYPSYGYGMNDIAGNIKEWTSSYNGGFRVARGGGWRSTGRDDIYTVWYRQGGYPHSTLDSYGFRVCR